MEKYLAWFVISISLTSCLEDTYRKASKQGGKAAAIYVNEVLNASKEETEKRKQEEKRKELLKVWEKHCLNEKGEILKNKAFVIGKEEPVFCEKGFKE
jgi:hypothetical protein